MGTHLPKRLERAQGLVDKAFCHEAKPLQKNNMDGPGLPGEGQHQADIQPQPQ